MITLLQQLNESIINEQRVKTLLWIDDIRDPNEGDWVLKYSPIGTDVKVIWVKSYDECIKYITSKGLPTAVCFDHDLGDISRENDDEKTGYDCAKWIADYCLDHHKNIQHSTYSQTMVLVARISIVIL